MLLSFFRKRHAKKPSHRRRTRKSRRAHRRRVVESGSADSLPEPEGFPGETIPVADGEDAIPLVDEEGVRREIGRREPAGMRNLL